MVAFLVKIESVLDMYYEKVRQHKKIIWLILAVLAFAFVLITVILCYYLIFTYPVNQVSHITNVTENADLVNKYRTTSVQIVAIIAQLFGGIAIFAGLIFAWGNLTTARDGQITERYTKAIGHLGAIDQLGNPAIEIRLGGIYALERISNESEKDYWQIMEILTAYVRKNSPIVNGNSNNQNKVSFDIQAILTVIGRCKYSFNAGEDKRLNLRGTFLQDADLFMANLEGAELNSADLSGAHLVMANLSGADLVMANLSDASLDEAHLEGAELSQAHLEGAELSDAYLSDADLSDTNLRGANLFGVDLRGANLNRANNLTIDQLSKVKTLYEAELDDELLIPLKEKYPALFDKPEE